MCRRSEVSRETEEDDGQVECLRSLGKLKMVSVLSFEMAAAS